MFRTGQGTVEFHRSKVVHVEHLARADGARKAGGAGSIVLCRGRHLGSVSVQASLGHARCTTGVVDPGSVERRRRMTRHAVRRGVDERLHGGPPGDRLGPADQMTDTRCRGQRLFQRGRIIARADHSRGLDVTEHELKLARGLEHRRGHDHAAEPPHR